MISQEITLTLYNLLQDLNSDRSQRRMSWGNGAVPQDLYGGPGRGGGAGGSHAGHGHLRSEHPHREVDPAKSLLSVLLKFYFIIYMYNREPD